MQSNLALLSAIFASINLKFNVWGLLHKYITINARQPKIFCYVQNDNLEDINSQFPQCYFVIYLYFQLTRSS